MKISYIYVCVYVYIMSVNYFITRYRQKEIQTKSRGLMKKETKIN